MKILIGSSALLKYIPALGREPKDVDYFVSTPYQIEAKRGEYVKLVDIL